MYIKYVCYTCITYIDKKFVIFVLCRFTFYKRREKNFHIIILLVLYSEKCERDRFKSIIPTFNKNIHSGTRLAAGHNIICYAKLSAILRVQNLYPCDKTMLQSYLLVAIKEQQHAESQVCPKSQVKYVKVTSSTVLSLPLILPSTFGAASRPLFSRCSCKMHEYICTLENIYIHICIMHDICTLEYLC